LKMPEPTKTPSTPICIIKAASAGDATPPAAKFTTGNLQQAYRRQWQQQQLDLQHCQQEAENGFLLTMTHVLADACGRHASCNMI